jgi:hypothetical protein
MSRYSQDHKFSKAIAECFRDIGEYQFVNPIDSYPWGGRNRVIGRIRVFEKYLQPEDTLKARWLQQQAVAAAPKDWEARDVGIVYLNKLMDERSGGKYIQEMSAIAQGLPSVMEYAEKEWGPTPGQLSAMKQKWALKRRSELQGIGRR